MPERSAGSLFNLEHFGPIRQSVKDPNRFKSPPRVLARIPCCGSQADKRYAAKVQFNAPKPECILPESRIGIPETV